MKSRLSRKWYFNTFYLTGSSSLGENCSHWLPHEVFCLILINDGTLFQFSYQFKLLTSSFARPIVSPPMASSRPTLPNNVATSQANQKASPTALLSTPDLEQVPQGKSWNGNIQKREKSPPLLSSQLSPQSNKYFAHDDPER